MNEIRLLKELETELIEIEVEPAEIDAPCGTSAVDPEVFATGTDEPAYPPLLPAEDRRVSQRYRAREGRCWVGWHESGGFRQSAAWIIDISVSGGLIATDVPPPNDRSVWIRLDNPSVPDWAETRLVTLQSSHAGIYAARIVFRGTCPYALLKEVAFGSTNPQASRPEPPSSWKLNAW